MFTAGDSESEDKPIVLDDPVRSFRDWAAVLMTYALFAIVGRHFADIPIDRCDLALVHPILRTRISKGY